MNNFSSALWVEILKMRRSRVPFFTALGFAMLPFTGGLFMIILKDPGTAKAMGLISAKAQLLVGVADWPAYMEFMLQAVAVGSLILFSIVTTWVFGREYSDRTVKELLALPTRRETLVTAKFVVIGLWSLTVTLLVFAISLLVGYLIDLPGWSVELLNSTFIGMIGCVFLTLGLIPFVAFIASIGRGYLPPFGWIILTMALSQVIVIMGWGDRFPWAIPALFTGMAGPRTEVLGLHSYLILLTTFILGLVLTYGWWRDADQTR